MVNTPASAQDTSPAWAYPVNPPDFKLTPDDGAARHVPNSTVSLTLTQVRDRFFAPDWHPEDHPPMPEVVANGRKPDVSACGYCHRTDGSGGPENANIAGLPAEYIVQQMADFKSGARKSSVQKRAPTELKASLARAITDDEVKAAATYFASIKPRPTIAVVETDMVAKTRVFAWFLAVDPDGGKDPIDQRLVEVADNLEQFISRDSRVRFTAFVPKGSIEKGRNIADSANEAIRCRTCHGSDLKGGGTMPGIAGRSPTYIFRQLYDYKSGARAGAGADIMKAIVQKLSAGDMIALAAYAGSLEP